MKEKKFSEFLSNRLKFWCSVFSLIFGFISLSFAIVLGEMTSSFAVSIVLSLYTFDKPFNKRNIFMSCIGIGLSVFSLLIVAL